MTANARDVIARTLPDAIRDATRIYPEPGIVASMVVYPDIADAIIAALNASGFEIVQREVVLSDILLDAFGQPESIEEVAPNTFKYTWAYEDDAAPIQKPEPDWGRRGTQPNGTLGDPPPPNGKRVAMKPLPPTPGPFNPFGKQDDE